MKYLDYPTLKRLNDSSVRAGRNQNLYLGRIPGITEATLFPVTMALEHNEREIRLILQLSEDDTGLLDISYQEYEMLPDMPNWALQGQGD